MNPIDLIGNMVLVGSILLTGIAVFWLPMVRRRELANIAEQKNKPIFVELQGSSQFNPDGSARSEAIFDLSVATEVVLKKKQIPGSNEADIEVVTAQGQLLGLLPAVPGRELAKELAADRKIDAKIDLLSGGTEQEPDYYITLVLKRQSAQTGRRR